jgi:DNA mismatch repair protein MutS2
VDDITLETLEYPAVLRELAALASTPPGRDKAAGLRPSADIQAVLGALEEYKEAEALIKSSGRIPLGGVSDIRAVLDRAVPEGAFLLPDELLVIKANMEAALGIRGILAAGTAEKHVKEEYPRGKYPKISALIRSLSDHGPALADLDRALDERGEIRDDASRALSRIRREIRSSRQTARRALERLGAGEPARDDAQDGLITIRDDRYVFTVSAGRHTAVEGVIHGRSGSGLSYFVEPLELIALNNRVAILKKEEKAEETEVLRALTALVSSRREPLLADLGIMAEIDCLQAKVLLSSLLGSEVPDISAPSVAAAPVRLKAARHPLLVLKEARGEGGAVPVDITIDQGRSVLVISGANAGGKTVALKTLGLLILMAQSGMPVPAGRGSAMRVFTSVFSDIGDRQDIGASLSTFSAHVKRMGAFLEEAGEGSIVLIDEIGAGTDPSEGGALALAVLEALRRSGALIAVTTHLNLLKASARTDPACVNASVEFDEAALRPLYRLNYGMPGPSLGLSIAESLGMPSRIIERARENLGDKEGAFIESIRLIEAEKEEVARLKSRLAALEAERREAIERLKAEKRVIIDKAREAAAVRVKAIVKKAEDEIREAIERLKEERERSSPARALGSVREAGRTAEASLNPVSRRESFSPGDSVVISGTGARGRVIKVDEAASMAEVDVKGIKVWAGLDRLSGASGKEKARAVQEFDSNADIKLETVLNIIGLRADEARGMVERFLDNAHAAGLDSVEVIHGVGTGRLKKAVDGMLGASPVVKRFYCAGPERGGAGVTVVELK